MSEQFGKLWRDEVLRNRKEDIADMLERVAKERDEKSLLLIDAEYKLAARLAALEEAKAILVCVDAENQSNSASAYQWLQKYGDK